MPSPFGRTSIYDGLDVGILQAKLTAMQLALLKLESGSQLVKATYGQGDGVRSVEYRPPDMVHLRGTILELQTAIDQINGISLNRRRPIRPYF